MLSDKTSSAIAAVPDLRRTRAVNSEISEPKPAEDGDAMTVYRTRPRPLAVDRSREAGTRRAAAEAGEMDGLTFEGGIHRAGERWMIAFEHPDGSLLTIDGIHRPGAGAGAIRRGKTLLRGPVTAAACGRVPAFGAQMTPFRASAARCAAAASRQPAPNPSNPRRD